MDVDAAPARAAFVVGDQDRTPERLITHLSVETSSVSLMLNPLDDEIVVLQVAERLRDLPGVEFVHVAGAEPPHVQAARAAVETVRATDAGAAD